MRTRALLGAATAALFLAGGAGAGVVSSLDTYDGVSFHSFTVDPGNDACIPWLITGTEWTRNCDPLNVVFPGQTVAQVEQRLARHGWTVGTGSTQELGSGTPLAWAPQDAQMVYQQDAADRFHVRLWQLPGFVVGGVHHDLGVTNHVVDLSWETSEAFLATALCSDRCGTLALPDQSAVEGASGTWRGLANDGVATVVPLPPPPPGVTTTTPRPRKHPKHGVSG